MKNRKFLATSLLIAFALAGCAGEEATKPTAGDEKGAASAQTAPATDKSAAGASLSDRERQRRAELLAQRRVYFAFDSSNIDDEARAISEAHAANLVANPQIKLSLEGNCDERGTREYNIALGAKRATTVRNFLAQNGINGARIRTISYGKERPVAVCNDISCWSQNRRAQTVLNARDGAVAQGNLQGN